MLRPMPSARWKSSKRRMPEAGLADDQQVPPVAEDVGAAGDRARPGRRVGAGHVRSRVVRCVMQPTGTVRCMTEPTPTDDDRHPHGQVHTTVVDDHVLHMTVDRVEKKNAFTPKITGELGAAMTRLDDDPDLWVGVLTFAGDHTTAGLDMPLFFGPDADRSTPDGPEPVDPFGLRRRLTKPLVSAVQGITFTIGIEVPLAGDIIVAASDARFCQLEPKRGLAPLGGATIRYVQRAGWGNAMYHLLTADEFSAAEAYRIGLVQEVVDPGQQVERALAIAAELATCAPAGARPHDRQRPPRARRGRAGRRRGDPGDERGGAGHGRLPGGHHVVHRATGGAASPVADREAPHRVDRLAPSKTRSARITSARWGCWMTSSCSTSATRRRRWPAPTWPSWAPPSCGSRTSPATCCAGAAATGTTCTTPASAAWRSTPPTTRRGIASRPRSPGVDVVIGPLEPDAATLRFLDRAAASEGDRLGIVDVVVPPRRPAPAGHRPDPRRRRRLHRPQRRRRRPAGPGRRRPRLQAGGARRRRGGAGAGHRPPHHRAGRPHRRVGPGGGDADDVPDVERQPLPLARRRAEPPRADRRRLHRAQRRRAVDVVHDPPAELPALRRVGRARHRADGADRPRSGATPSTCRSTAGS